MVGGQLLTFGWGLETVFSMAAVPALIAAVAILAKGWVGASSPMVAQTALEVQT